MLKQATSSAALGDGIQARDSSLPHFLACRARQASDGRLVLYASIGLIGVVAAIVLARRSSLVLGFGGACFTAFGLWGIADRELDERRATISRAGGVALLAVRRLAAILGFIAALCLLYGGLAVTLGPMIS